MRRGRLRASYQPPFGGLGATNADSGSDGEEERMFFLRRSWVRGLGEGVLLENSGRNLSRHLGVPAHLEKKL